MQFTVAIQEVALVLATQPQNPAVVNNLEFLKYSGVIPMDWELLREPIYREQVVQLSFQNGLTITAHPTRIIFSQITGEIPIAVFEISAVAKRYVQSLSNMPYEAVGLNPMGHAILGDQPDAVSKYFHETLLAPGAWQAVGTVLARPQMSFVYGLDQGEFTLTVREAALREEDKITPIVLFSGNFNYDLAAGSQAERLSSLYDSLDRWQVDLETYQVIVNQNFLASVATPPALLPVFA